MRTLSPAGSTAVIAAVLGGVVLVVLLALPRPVGAEEAADLEYYWGDGCPVCEVAEVWLDDLEEANPDLEVARYEVWYDDENQERFVSTLAERGEEASGVPAFVVGEEVWIGYTEQIAEDIEAELSAAAAEPAAEADEGFPFSTVILATIAALGVVLAIVAVSRAGGSKPVKR